MNCVICGKEISRSSYSHKIICSGICFTIDFWNEIVNEKEKHLFINGHSYLAKPYKCNPQDSRWLGHSGRTFYIQKNNGELIITNDLWCQGEVADSHKHLLPNNAKFISKKEFEYLKELEERNV